MRISLEEIFALTNANGMAVRITNYGGIIMSLLVPDARGRQANVVIGFDTIEQYRNNPQYFGAIVGRYANRIAHGRFELDGKTYRLATNNGANHLHGGRVGFDKVVWEARLFDGRGSEVTSLVLSHTSPDGDEGYPGTLTARVTYSLTNRNELIVDYFATTDKPTPVNLTQHSYFNLAGVGDVLDHLLQIHADGYTPVDKTLIPTGAIAPVAGTDFDFRTPTVVGARRVGLYDHNFVLKSGGGAKLVDPKSGRTLVVRTTEPGVQLYTGYKLGLALETQHYPDSPNRPNFPSTILRPGAEYRSRTAFAFGMQE
ncbi:MAG TPA: aldose epimerase family protein [Gemmatimonadales bacterium]|nr:aldose epimerase family protein [Gemmatimonadales bacterium]